MSAPSESDFGDLLRRYRKAAGLTQAELAERAKLSLRGLNDLERGARTTPRRDTAQLLADGLGLQGEERANFLSVARRPRSSASELPPNLPPESPSLPAGVAHKHNLPAQATPLLGRAREVTTLCALLQRDDVRLVTLTGPGGVGKTRLSLQVAAELLAAFPDGVWNIRLSRLTDPELVLPTIATTLGLREGGGTPLVSVLRGYLRDKLLLLVLDNFEHVVGAASSVGELLESAPNLRVLVTSRAPLRLQGEHDYGVKPLALPDLGHTPPPESLSQYAAVALFIERAQASQADFQVTNANAPAIAEICARLDGLPLAIELAAARAKLLSPPALLARLQKQLAVLTGGARDLDERQQTMRNTLAWSYELLTPEEQRLFCRLAVFAGGCTLEAIEAVCVAPEGAESMGLETLDVLGTLVDHNLIQQREDERGEPRFGMLHVIREFALEQLETSDEAAALRRAHMTYFLRWAQQAPQVFDGTAERMAMLPHLKLEHDNLRAVLGLARDQANIRVGLPLIMYLVIFWEVCGHLTEARHWAETFIALASELLATRGPQEQFPHLAREYSWALLSASNLALNQADVSSACMLAQQALVAARQAGDQPAEFTALVHVALTCEDDQERSDLVETCLAATRDLTDEAVQSWGYAAIAEYLNGVGEESRAIALAEEGLRIAERLGEIFNESGNRINVAQAALSLGNFALADKQARQTLRDADRYGLIYFIPTALEVLAQLAVAASTVPGATRAARLLGVAAAMREAAGFEASSPDRVKIELAASQAKFTLGEDAWIAAVVSGRALSLNEAVAEALGE
jgi:predicted ATPase/transcriptional regulator with XRE-family HTH domain